MAKNKLLKRFLELWQENAAALQGVDALEIRLGYRFHDRAHLFEALTHSSAALSQDPDKPRVPWNERLEFLGDAVLDLAISTLLMRRDESLDEGDLSKMRASVVNQDVLAQLARTIELGPCILLGRGEIRQDGASKDSILADAMEALIGAIYLDAGFPLAMEIIDRLFTPILETPTENLINQDFKTMLQEMTQRLFGVCPKYEITGSTGPEHSREFEIAVKVDGRVIGQGRGVTKKKASQEAAREAWDLLSNMTTEARVHDEEPSS